MCQSEEDHGRSGDIPAFREDGNALFSGPQSHILGAILLVCFALITCLAGLGSGPAMGDHEAINAQAARQTIQSGQWLIPHLGEIPRIRKTPLGIWLTAATSWLVDSPATAPVSELSARLPSALAGFINVLGVWWLGSMIFGSRAGLVAGFISAGCAATVFYSHNAQVDMLLTLLTTLSFACFYRGALHSQPGKGFLVWFYVALAAAMMAKAPLPLATVGLPLAVFWFLTIPVLSVAGRRDAGEKQAPVRQTVDAIILQFKRLPGLWLIPGVILFLVLAGAWPLYVYLKIDNALSLWVIEYLDRYTGDMSDHSQPFLYYIPILFGLTAPFLLSLPEAVASPFMKRYRPQRDGLAFAFTWAIVATLFLSTSSFKRPHYVLSVIPAYCLLLAPVIDRLFFGAVSVASRAVQHTCRILPIALGITLFVGGVVLHIEYPDLFRAYVVVACCVLAAWTFASRAYARGGRTASFALLNASMLIIVLVAWPVAGKHINTHSEGQALAQALREHGVRVDDAIYWVGGRPDASIEFYSAFRIQRLINEIEMSAMRKDRRTLSAGLYRAFAQRIEQHLAEPHPVYIILSSGHYGMLQRNMDIHTRVLLELNGFHDEAGDDLVVITQPEGPSHEVTSRPLVADELRARSQSDASH